MDDTDFLSPMTPMAHRIDDNDRDFVSSFEAGGVAPAAFDHRAHLRLAYVYTCENDDERSFELMRDALRRFLKRNNVDPAKFSETITRAWILAVRHFMKLTPGSDSASSFIRQNPVMLDSKIMLTHYSAEVLFSDAAREAFVEPDLDPIPRYR
jgi:hypothetical protein